MADNSDPTELEYAGGRPEVELDRISGAVAALKTERDALQKEVNDLKEVAADLKTATAEITRALGTLTTWIDVTWARGGDEEIKRALKVFTVSLRNLEDRLGPSAIKPSLK